MNIPALIASLALIASCTGAASGQLSNILAPLPSGLELAKADQISDVRGAPDVQTTPQSSAAPADNHRDLTGDDILNAVQKQLVAYFGLKGDLKLSLLRDWRPIRLTARDFDLTITDYPSDGVTSSFTLKVRIASGGVLVGEWQLGVRAQLWQSVWVTQGRLDRGQSLDRSVLNSQKIDVLREKQTLLSDEVDPTGYDVAQGIGPGLPVPKQAVIERPLIHKGDVVEVVAAQGLLDIHMKALALEDGGPNALIRMRNLDSSKDFNAQILNENEVKVHF